MCVPEGTFRPADGSVGWIAYAYIGGWLSVYNGDDQCNDPSTHLHEVGHNWGLEVSRLQCQCGIPFQTITSHTRLYRYSTPPISTTALKTDCQMVFVALNMVTCRVSWDIHWKDSMMQSLETSIASMGPILGNWAGTRSTMKKLIH